MIFACSFLPFPAENGPLHNWKNLQRTRPKKRGSAPNSSAFVPIRPTNLPNLLDSRQQISLAQRTCCLQPTSHPDLPTQPARIKRTAQLCTAAARVPVRDRADGMMEAPCARHMAREEHRCIICMASDGWQYVALHLDAGSTETVYLDLFSLELLVFDILLST